LQQDILHLKATNAPQVALLRA